MAKIVTGHKGTDHITSDDVSSFQQGIVGDFDFLLSDEPDDFVATIGSNNTISLCDANIIIQGTHARIFDTDSVTVEQGTAGETRIDSIVIKYTKSAQGVEDVTVYAKRGTTEPPELEQTDIRGAGTVREVALWNVTLNGNVLSEPVRVIPYINSLKLLQSKLAANIVLAEALQAAQTATGSSITAIQNSLASMASDIATLNSKQFVNNPFRIKNQSSQNDEKFSTRIGNYVSTYKSGTGAIDLTATYIENSDASNNEKSQHIFYSDGNKAVRVGGTWYGQPFIQRGTGSGTPNTKDQRIIGHYDWSGKTYNVYWDFYTCTVNVTFPKAYAAAPMVFVTLNTSAPNVVWAGVSDVTKNGFKVNIARLYKGQLSGFQWVAFGNL